MHVHILSNSVVKLSRLRGLLGEACDVTTELLNSTKLNGQRYDAVIAAIDLRQPETIVALKEISQDLARVPKRIFLVDHPSRLTTMQSYALGATAVVSPPINRASLLAVVLDQPAVAAHAAEGTGERLRIASVAADYVASMFRASMRGVPIDVNEAAVSDPQISVSLISWRRCSLWLQSPHVPSPKQIHRSNRCCCRGLS
jgi:CheY-like chemotaxis protein